MAKPQGNDCYIDCFVVLDPELKGLFYRRAKAVYEVDMDTGYILPLLVGGPGKAAGSALRIKGYIEEMEFHMEDFKMAHG